jgi:outer membrane lipoprotein carrier protein
MSEAIKASPSSKQPDSLTIKSIEIDKIRIDSAEVSSVEVSRAESLNPSLAVNPSLAIVEPLTSENSTDIADNTILSTNNDEVTKAKLKTLLNAMAFFSADFLQKVFDEEDNIITQHQGRLAVSKPNLVRWHTMTPDETLIVSDGNVLWFFDPFIEQASVYTLDAAIANTPILLLSNNDKALWENYTVRQIAQASYQINAKDNNSSIRTLELHFAVEGDTNNQRLTLTSLSLMDTTGQLSVISLSNIDITNRPETDLFNFSLPEGVDLDDQR